MNPHTAIRYINRDRKLAGALVYYLRRWIRAREMTQLRWLLENT